MNLRKLLISAVAFGAIASTSPVFAQANKGKGMNNPDAMVSRIDENVGLTPEQKAKIKAIYAKVQEKVQALPQEERRTKGMEIRQSANKEIRALLTPDQQKKFDSMAPMGGGGGAGGKKKKDQ